MGFTIKELESLTGIKAHTIRIWEQRYRFLKPSRTATNIRTYNNEELKTLLTVALLNKYGFKISKIDNMGPEQRKREVLSLQFEDARQEHVINELVGHMIDMNARAFEAEINAQIRLHGIEGTILQTVFRFMEKTGILWQTGRINPAHEHVVSNIIRQKLIAAIEGLPLADAAQPLTLLLLPEGEFHELGLLYVYFLLRRKGAPALYLGANMPLKDALYAARFKKPENIYLHLTAAHHRNQFVRFLNGLTAGVPESRIVLSGQAVADVPTNMPANLTLLQSLSAVHSYISML